MSADEAVIATASAEETESLGKAMWPLLKDGAFLALRGDLAAGKTCFVRGMAMAAGVADRVHSPTFTLVNEYPSEPRIFHLDLYRLESPDQLYDLGWEDIIGGPHIIAVEWPERAEPILPPTRIDLKFTHGGKDRREVTIRNLGVSSDVLNLVR